MEIKYFRQEKQDFKALIMKQVAGQEYYKDDPEGTEEGWINFVMKISNSTAKLNIYFLKEPIEKTLDMDYRNDDYYFYDKK